MIVDPTDLVLDTILDKEVQRTIRLQEERRDRHIKFVMVAIGVLGCCWCLREIGIPLGSGTGMMTLAVCSLGLLFLSVCSNRIEFGVQLFILAVLAWLAAETIHRKQNRVEKQGANEAVGRSEAPRAA